MALEIERKFLVIGNDWKSSDSEYCIQGYLNLTPQRTVRVRRIGRQAFLTIKGITREGSRDEFEYEIPAEDAEVLFNLCEGSLIKKRRHTVFHRGTKWEVDEFLEENEGLVIAEVELTAADERFDKPSWLGIDVTDDPRYFNSNLAVCPFKMWPGKNNT